MKLALLLTLALFISVGTGRAAESAEALVGAWERKDAEQHVYLVTPDYWVKSIYDRAQRRFVRTYGGTYTQEGAQMSGRIEFDSLDRSRVGTPFRARVTVDGATLRLQSEDGAEEVWTRTDEGKAPLAGVWRISERKVEDAMTPLPLRPRRTLKILTGQRFQWVAINVKTGEFSGTGGGTYTLENGKYTESIEYFSRDASRVGASLAFDAEVAGDRWVHRGASSKGDPIHEVWARFRPSAE